MRDVLEIVVRLGETTLEHRFEPLGTRVDGLDQVGPAWSHARRGLAEVAARRTTAPTKHALAVSVGDRRCLGYVAVSLAAHLVVWGVATDEPPELAVRRDPPKQVAARIARAAPVSEPPRPWEVGDSPDYDLDGGGQPKMGLEGKAGGDAVKELGHVRLAKGPVPAVTSRRQQAIEQARTAGILGSAAVIASSVGHLTSMDDFNAGFDTRDVQGPLYGGSGEGGGRFGLGRTGFDGSAGCGANCNGVIGSGRYGTISNGESIGDHWGGHRAGAAGGWPLRGRRVPGVQVIPCAGPMPCVVEDGGLDKAVIRRYIRRELSKIQYCFERELLGNADLRGTVATHFLIQLDGHVSTVEASGVSPSIASCVSDVIRRIEFPTQREGLPDRRTVTEVRYPFTLRAGS